MLNAAEALLYRFQTTMARADAEDAMADVAQLLRDAATRIEEINPDRGSDFTEGVEWALDELRNLASQIEDVPST